MRWDNAAAAAEDSVADDVSGADDVSVADDVSGADDASGAVDSAADDVGQCKADGGLSWEDNFGLCA